MLGELVYRRLQFTELRFDEVGPATFGNHELVKLDRTGFAGYLKFRTDLDEDKIDERLRRGHEWYGIVVDGEIAQTSWVASGGAAWVGYLDCEIRLGARDVYVYEFLVHPPYRRRKLFPAALSRLVVEYRAAATRESSGPGCPRMHARCLWRGTGRFARWDCLGTGKLRVSASISPPFRMLDGLLISGQTNSGNGIA